MPRSATCSRGCACRTTRVPHHFRGRFLYRRAMAQQCWRCADHRILVSGRASSGDRQSRGFSRGSASLGFSTASTITGGAAGALNGNLAANRSSMSSSISGLAIPNGTEVMLRWSDPDHTGPDHGLSIDQFRNEGGLPSPNLTIGDVAASEGDSGTTGFTFTVSLSSPAGPGGVTFDVATADGLRATTPTGEETIRRRRRRAGSARRAQRTPSTSRSTATRPSSQETSSST